MKFEPTVCPCGLSDYQTCCQPYHQGQIAPTAERLMRSRYSAYVLQDIDYIIRTTVPAQAGLLDRAALSQWAAQMHWRNLEIVSIAPKIGKRHAQVHFRAYFDKQDNFAGNDNGVGCHDERSAFVKIKQGEETRWYFLDPTVPNSLTNKQPCLCDSGEKFKACCGKFLVAGG
ncbi:YchJ family protein [Moraxella marmotae]|uniref:YchJ family protein n=1 Tax=Moraxella marmotae TaxID=3344520 RepID=UPI0035F28A27